ncbi:MAG: DUF1801 domain-containing protein [Nocardioidaceae bacterium]
MTTSALDEYLAGVDAAAAPGLTALDRAIRGAHPDFDVAIKYKILMYAIESDWRHWVCAINTTRKGVCIRFLYGVMLDDPRGVLRAGTSTLMTWDFAQDDTIDPTAVGAYVSEAVAKYPDYKTNAREVAEASRASAKGRGRPTDNR